MKRHLLVLFQPSKIQRFLFIFIILCSVVMQLTIINVWISMFFFHLLFEQLLGRRWKYIAFNSVIILIFPMIKYYFQFNLPVL